MFEQMFHLFHSICGILVLRDESALIAQSAKMGVLQLPQIPQYGDFFAFRFRRFCRYLLSANGKLDENSPIESRKRRKMLIGNLFQAFDYRLSET